MRHDEMIPPLSGRTEFDIQCYLFKHLRTSQKYKASGTSLYGGYADFVSITKAGYITEYEIKLSLNDFKADFKKSGGRKHHRMKERIIGNYGRCFYPNYFYFVIPDDLLQQVKPLVPEHAGLIALPCIDTISPIINAPLLHRDKATENQFKDMLISMSWKWHMKRRI